MRRFFTFLLLLILLLGAWLAWAMFSPVTPAGSKFVLLRPGYSTRHIGIELKKAGVIHNPYAFLIWHYFHRGRSLKAGEYLFDKAADVREIHSRLARGDVYVHTVVIPEGFTIFDVARAMEESGLGSSHDFLKLAKSGASLVADLDPQAHSLEGYLFPATYEFTRTQSLQDMIGMMVKQFRQEAGAIGLTSGMDVHRIVTMASIVEKETAVPDERPMVAGVYYNRLSRGIALDADPSIIYGELLDGTYSGALHHADMQVNSPYNTYRHPGLPPGPIANPGRSALQAAMHPAASDYYYFVADGSGHHRFSKSLEEHNRNVAALRRAMRGR